MLLIAARCARLLGTWNFSRFEVHKLVILLIKTRKGKTLPTMPTRSNAWLLRAGAIRIYELSNPL